MITARIPNSIKEAIEKVDREVVGYLTKRLRDVNLID